MSLKHTVGRQVTRKFMNIWQQIKKTCFNSPAIVLKTFQNHVKIFATIAKTCRAKRFNLMLRQQEFSLG